MTWDAYNRRKNVLREMIAIADRRRDVTLTDLLTTVEGGREAFPTDTDLLFELQMTWFQRLSGQMDRLISDGHDSPELVPVTAWVSTAAQLPGTRALLDAHLDEPALRKAFAKELSYLALSAGVPAVGPALAAHGRRIQQAARDEVAAAPPVALADETRPSLITRLRNAIAA